MVHKKDRSSQTEKRNKNGSLQQMLKTAVLSFAFGGIFYIVHEEGIAVLYNTDHCFTRVQLNFVAVIVIISRRAVIGGLFPGDMDSFAVRKIPAVSCCVVALESKITFLVAHFKVGILDEYIFEGQLFVIGQIHMRAVCGTG